MPNNETTNTTNTTTTTKTKTKAEKLEVVIDLRVVIQPPRHIAAWYGRDLKRYEQELKRWADQIYEHVRDHRSLDLVGIDVERITEIVGSNCKQAWSVAYDEDESDTETNVPYCANCGEEAKV